VNEECEAVVFMLWGAYAQRKAAFVDTTRHLVLKAPIRRRFRHITGFSVAVIFPRRMRT
jgi:uracil DNA glycosylase